MMLFLCNHNNTNIFDFLNESVLVGQPFMLKKISATQLDLYSFAKKEALSINYYKYLAVDLSSVENDPESFKTAIQSIHMLNPKIKFLYVDIENKKTKLQEVIRGFDEIPIITSNPEKDSVEYKNQVAMSLQYTPNLEEINSKSKDSAKETEIPQPSSKNIKKEYIFENRDVMIAVLNSCPRSGATTLSINMAVCLHSMGASVAYVECNSALDHFESIRNSTSGFTAVNESRFDRNGVIYMKNEIPEGMDFVICDMSRIIHDGSEANALEFASGCNTVILCGTSKPYELQEIKNKIRILEEHGCSKILLCLAFTPESEKANLIDILGTKNVSIYFIGYTPDMFKGSVNSEMIRKMLQEFIKEKLNDKMLKLF